MKKLIILIFVLLSTLLYSQQRDTVTLTKVVDGDTFWAKFPDGSQKKVRLIGVNAPESKSSPYLKKQFFGDSSKIYFKQFFPAGTVLTLEYDKQLFDSFKRVLAYVYYKDIFVNKFTVEMGWTLSTSKKYKPNIKYSVEFDDAQTWSKKTKKGIWKYLQ